jgi:Uma2 family endonuclease
MTTATLEGRYTPEDLLAMEDGHCYELVDGRLVEKNMGAEAGVIVANLIALLVPHVRSRKLGLVFTNECGYQIFGDANRVRKPDASVIRRGRLPDDRAPRGHARIPPDLAVEVVSPNDLAEDIDARITDYLGAGVKLLWVLYPATRSVYIFRPDGSAARLTAAGTLGGEDVLPDFTCRVEDLFAET